MTITRVDVLHLSTNFACMFQMLNGKSEDQMPTAAKAVLDHHFDCNKHCSDWYKQKEQTLDQKDEKKKCC